MKRSPKAIFVGEGMLELSRRGAGWAMGYGGDTLNTAIHLARCGVDTAYFTGVGCDLFSRQLLTEWGQAGLDTSLVLTDPERNVGIYAITTDAAGERNFTYWRGDSAARQLFSLPGVEQAEIEVAQADLLGFSLITLAILPPEGRNRLLSLCRKVRTCGGKVAFDGNYRPRLWPSKDEARHARDAAIALANFGLPTLDDEAQLGGAADPASVQAYWRRLGCEEVVVKLGAKGCLLPNEKFCAPETALTPVDTSGAGDAFNAAYLAARLAGAEPQTAALRAHRLAGWTVMRMGGIPAPDSDLAEALRWRWDLPSAP